MSVTTLAFVLFNDEFKLTLCVLTNKVVTPSKIVRFNIIGASPTSAASPDLKSPFPILNP